MLDALTISPTSPPKVVRFELAAPTSVKIADPDVVVRNKLEPVKAQTIADSSADLFAVGAPSRSPVT